MPSARRAIRRTDSTNGQASVEEPPLWRKAAADVTLTASEWRATTSANGAAKTAHRARTQLPGRQIDAVATDVTEACGIGAVPDEAREIADRRGLVFPSPTGRALSDGTLSKLLRELGAAPCHTADSSFRDWAAERTDMPRDVCELALAHGNSDRVEAAYRRTDLFDRRRVLMADWVAYVAWRIPSPRTSRRRSRVRDRQTARPGSIESVSGRDSSRGLRPGHRDESARHRHGRLRMQPDHPVADRSRGEAPPGRECLETNRGRRVRLPGRVVQPAAVGVDRYGVVAQPASTLATDRRRRLPPGCGFELRRPGLWPRGVRPARSLRGQRRAPVALFPAPARRFSFLMSFTSFTTCIFR